MYPEEGSWSEIINIQELEVGRGITTWARHSTASGRSMVVISKFTFIDVDIISALLVYSQFCYIIPTGSGDLITSHSFNHPQASSSFIAVIKLLHPLYTESNPDS
jgi:hypothetical protein